VRPTGEVVSPRNHTPTIRVLYSEGCPGGEASVRLLREALAQTAPGTEVEAVELSSQAFSELDTPGSPTILVKGRDLFPAGQCLTAAASCCRLYATPEGLKSHPTAGMLKDALKSSDVGGATGSQGGFHSE